jgi:hypothetical protein
MDETRQNDGVTANVRMLGNRVFRPPGRDDVWAVWLSATVNDRVFQTTQVAPTAGEAMEAARIAVLRQAGLLEGNDAR